MKITFGIGNRIKGDNRYGIPKGLVRGGDRSMAPDANQSAEARTMRLKGYGNAIVPQVAALFIAAAMQSL